MSLQELHCNNKYLISCNCPNSSNQWKVYMTKGKELVEQGEIGTSELIS